MDIPTIINISLCILSFILSAISVITVVITLRQNSKMIESSSRAYVVAYGTVTDCHNLNYYLIIKNFGQSGAVITDYKCSIDLKKYSFYESLEPFSHIKDSFLAPNQSLVCSLNQLKLFKEIHEIKITISYISNGKHYCQTFPINLDVESSLVRNRASTDGKELQIISYTLQELIERLF